MIAGRLTMRALLERAVVAGNDSWGQPAEAGFASTGDPLPCFVYSNSGTEIIDGQKIAQVEQLRVMFALEADVLPEDEIASVTNKRGVEIIPGRLQVLGPVQRKHTHLEAALRRIA